MHMNIPPLFLSIQWARSTVDKLEGILNMGILACGSMANILGRKMYAPAKLARRKTKILGFYTTKHACISNKNEENKK